MIDQEITNRGNDYDAAEFHANMQGCFKFAAIILALALFGGGLWVAIAIYNSI